jgi:hypothetical protein
VTGVNALEAPGHWQIVKHRPDGSREGGFHLRARRRAPELIDIAIARETA